MATPIGDYGLIGNCETAALVSKAGSIDWFCPPCFDSAACFAALLGTPDNGRFQIAPRDPSARVTRKYRDGTLILETTFETKDGAATLIDFMPRSGGCDLVRLVVGQRGRLDFHIELVIRFDYGVSVPWVKQLQDEPGLCAVAGPDGLVLRTPTTLEGENLRTIGDFPVAAGDTVPFVLSYGRSYGRPPAPLDPQRALADTDKFWRDWLHPCPCVGDWGEEVKRSLLTLKALNYEPTGGIVAAPTTSLPEFIGGPRNWDYRYCWLRDATFTLGALMSLGYYDEAKAWRDWLLRAVAGSPAQMQILYDVNGAKQVPERELPWLSGYEGSRPVRVGNAAMDQRQLDVYGEVLRAMHEALLRGM
ncbi:MAG TPA: glycoside hydrolase family 15 protein, partial [Methylocystis sp.]|nr:glycoside hydrolase family 15 protein [Methylocystis sp.]